MPPPADQQPAFDAKRLAQEMLQHDMRIAAQSRNGQIRADDTLARQMRSEESNASQISGDPMLAQQMVAGDMAHAEQENQEEEQSRSRGAGTGRIASMIRSIRQSLRNARGDMREGVRSLVTGEEPYQRFEQPPPPYQQHQQDQPFLPGYQQGPPQPQQFSQGYRQGPPGYQQGPPQPQQFSQGYQQLFQGYQQGPPQPSQRQRQPLQNPAYQRYEELAKTPLGKARQLAVQNAALELINKNPFYKRAYDTNNLPNVAKLANAAHHRQATSDKQKQADLQAGRAAAARGLQPEGLKRKRGAEGGPGDSATLPARKIARAHSPRALGRG